MAFKKDDKFMVLLSQIAENLQDSGNYMADYKIKNVSDLKTFSETMKEYESKGDTYIHTIIKELNRAFITPIEREDILQLANSMDDVLDGFEECSALFDMHSIVNIDEYMVKFVEALQKCTHEIKKAVELLSKKKLLQIREHVIKIKDYETNCDGIYRQSIKHLFSVEKDPIRIIQYKEIYEAFENIADDCQEVANTLETIIMKNA
jgi:uncharacterized protein